MPIDFKHSETKENLMKAFAGESQARNRYEMAAGIANKQNFQVVEMIFKFTADQEKEHAEVFYKYLTECSGENIQIEGSYPVDISNDVCELLKMAQHNEYEEHDDVYQAFGNKAREEGFENIAHTFFEIAKIEKTHGDRFGHLAELIQSNKLFVSDVKCKWMCLNCGNILEVEQVPQVCPVCQHDKGYFIRLELAPYNNCN